MKPLDPLFRRAEVSVLAALLAALLLTPPGASASPGRELTAEEVVRRNIASAGEAAAVAGIRNLSFSWGVQSYFVARDGRMKVESAFDRSAVFETLLVDGRSARRNRVNDLGDLTGDERAAWICFGRLAGGFFTLRNFPGPWRLEGTRVYGPERYHVLSTSVETLRAAFFVDSGDYRLKRMILSIPDASGSRRERCYEFDGKADVPGLTLPAMLYLSEVGVGGTSSPQARPLADLAVNIDLPDDFFRRLEITAGRADAAAGEISGRVIGAVFEDEDLFVRIFTNWTESDVARAGWRNGDLILVECNGAQFESRFYFTEDKVEPRHQVYEPGHSLMTHAPMRYPVFYVQFNNCAPKDRYELLRSRAGTLAPITGRRLK
ncbi:MAG: hypothetical protein WCC00_04710 [Candidatus Aminicenantales bacterium]